MTYGCYTFMYLLLPSWTAATFRSEIIWRVQRYISAPVRVLFAHTTILCDSRFIMGITEAVMRRTSQLGSSTESLALAQPSHELTYPCSAQYEQSVQHRKRL